MEKWTPRQITNAMGKEKNVQLCVLSAMDAWEFRQKFRWFLATDDMARRRLFIDEAFKLIKVETSEGNFTALLTSAVVANHIGTGDAGQMLLTWLFDELLSANDIDKQWCAERLTYSKTLGDKVARSFLSSAMPRLLSGEFMGR